jgi:catechol 2,3-dioxygenase-like lactoylglutathione lyase family enzyme
MTDDTRTTRIGEIGAIFVPVADQERALGFYRDVLGFEKRGDFTYGDGSRWIEVAPPGAKNTIALVPRSEGRPVGGDQTHCAFASADIAADQTALRAAGVEVDDAIAGTGTPRRGLISLDVTMPDPVPAQLFFRDPDGNRFLLVQPG